MHRLTYAEKFMYFFPIRNMPIYIYIYIYIYTMKHISVCRIFIAHGTEVQTSKLHSGYGYAHGQLTDRKIVCSYINMHLFMQTLKL
jgi:hypothetical protein